MTIDPSTELGAGHRPSTIEGDGEPILLAESVCVAYRRGEPERLSDFSARLMPGEVLCVVGESGAGKSTLLSALSGFVRPTAGKLVVAGVDLCESKARSGALSRLRRNLGIVLQSPTESLDPTQRVLDAVAEPLIHLRGVPVGESRAKAATLLDSLGLDRGKQQRKPFGLSGGECQRVAVARAIIHGPALLLADEPTANLDPPVARALLSELVRLSKEHRFAMVYVTHRLDEPEILGGRLIVLKQGKVVE